MSEIADECELLIHREIILSGIFVRAVASRCRTYHEHQELRSVNETGIPVYFLNVHYGVREVQRTAGTMWPSKKLK